MIYWLWSDGRPPFYVGFPWPWSLACEMALSVTAYTLVPLAALLLARHNAFRAGLSPLLVTLAVGEAFMTIATGVSSPGRNTRLHYVAITLFAFFLAWRRSQSVRASAVK
jgi:hypothetical protein